MTDPDDAPADADRPDDATPPDDIEDAAGELVDDQAEEFDSPHGITATYSPEDNKLRLYAASRLPRDLYERVRAAGFQWAPKQECFTAPSWTPAREDFALALAGEIGDEDYSPQERAADRAERFEEYRGKRLDEATGHADRFEGGPAAFGHQNRQRAERQVRRHDRHRGRAVSQWGKAEYWQQRTAGVISHALYKSSPAVRRGRILTIEAEERKQRKALDEYAARFAGWEKVYTFDGADRPGWYSIGERTPGVVSAGFDPATVTPALKLAYALANTGGAGYGYKHPRTGRECSIFSHLTDEADPITPAEAAALWLANRRNPTDPDSHANRWAAHYANRLAYERAMIAAEGGTADAADMEPGGWIKAGRRTGSVFTDVPGGWMQIHSVTRSPATKRVTSVKVMGTRSAGGFRPDARDDAPALVSINVQRLPESSYRPPTEEERAAFLARTAAAKKATAPKPPPLLNPTAADAEQLQAVWNRQIAERHKLAELTRPPVVAQTVRMTQAEYSERSKGYSPACETSEVTELLTIGGGRDRGRVVVFKVRTCYNGDGGYSLSARRVVILTDKPQQPLPFAEARRVAELQPTAETLAPHWPDIIAATGFNATDEQKRRYQDAVYLGWAADTRYEVRGLTTAGQIAYKAWKDAQAAAQAREDEPAEEITPEPAAVGALF
jgi:hypothetical protein